MDPPLVRNPFVVAVASCGESDGATGSRRDSSLKRRPMRERQPLILVVNTIKHRCTGGWILSRGSCVNVSLTLALASVVTKQSPTNSSQRGVTGMKVEGQRLKDEG